MKCSFPRDPSAASEAGSPCVLLGVRGRPSPRWLRAALCVLISWLFLVHRSEIVPLLLLLTPSSGIPNFESLYIYIYTIISYSYYYFEREGRAQSFLVGFS